MAICDGNSSFSVAQGARVGGSFCRSAGPWESCQDFTSLGFRAAKRMAEIASTCVRPDRELCTSLKGKNGVQVTEPFIYRMILENCLVHLVDMRRGSAGHL